MNQDAAYVLDTLRADGQRVTTARRLIVELLSATNAHLCADDIAWHIRRAHPEIHLSTIYRTLESFGEWGLVTSVHHPHGAAFFHLTHTHDHVVCGHCGLIRDVDSSAFAELVTRLRDEYDFAVHSGRVALSGRCRTHT